MAASIRTRITAHAILGSMVAAPALADDAAPPPLAATELQAIEVIGRRVGEPFSATTFSTTLVETRLLDIPQAISTITSDTLREQALMQLNDIAPFVAGLNEFSVYDDITIRGFRSADDRRINGLRTFNSFWSQPYIAHLDRIEVIKGPAAITFGDATPGGVINMITKKPLTEAGHELVANLGNYDHRYVALDSTGPLDESRRLPYRLNLSYWDMGSFRNQAFDEGYSVAPSLSWLAGERTRLNLDVVYIDRESVLDRGQPNVQGADTLGLVPIELMVTQPGDRLDTQSTSVALSAEHRFSDRWTFAAQYMHYAYDERLVEHRIRNYATPSVLNLLYVDRTTDATVDSGMAYFAGRFSTGPLEHKLVVGADALTSEYRGDQLQANNIATFDLFAPQYFERDTATYPVFSDNWAGKLEARAGFLQDQMTWGSWDLVAGIRYTHFTDRTAGAPKETDDAVVPRLGLVYRLSDKRSVYATWIEGFEAQSGYTPQEGGPFGPTSSRLYEVGYKQLAFGGRLLLTAALYELINEDIVIYANDESNPDLYRQVGQERARGFELEAVGRITPRLQVIANYAHNDAEVTRDIDPSLVGRTKENAPRHAATLWARYDLPAGFGLGAGATYVGERETFEAPLTLPSYTLLSAALSYQAGNLSLTVTGKNLTDKTHWTGGYNFGRVFPGDPRSVVLSAAYRF
jgi:iron complex outermembrane recepter protein